jgi:hypothetical protein
VGDQETAADQTAGTKHLADLFRVCTGGDIEVLGLQARKKIADAAADQVGLMTGLLERV